MGFVTLSSQVTFRAKCRAEACSPPRRDAATVSTAALAFATTALAATALAVAAAALAALE